MKICVLADVNMQPPAEQSIAFITVTAHRLVSAAISANLQARRLSKSKG